MKSTALSEHTITSSHKFDFKNVTILEKNVHKDVERTTLENFHIKKNYNSLNFQKDSEKFNKIYDAIVSETFKI